MSKVKLLPCPFCGGNLLDVANPKDNPAHESWVHCNICHCSNGCSNTEKKAIENWNARILTDREAKLVKTLRQIAARKNIKMSEIQGQPYNWEMAEKTLEELGIK